MRERISRDRGSQLSFQTLQKKRTNDWMSAFGIRTSFLLPSFPLFPWVLSPFLECEAPHCALRKRMVGFVRRDIVYGPMQSSAPFPWPDVVLATQGLGSMATREPLGSRSYIDFDFRRCDEPKGREREEKMQRRRRRDEVEIVQGLRFKGIGERVSCGGTFKKTWKK